MATGDGYRKIDSIIDVTGDRIDVGIVNDLVYLRINDSSSVWLNAEQRDQLIKAYAEAERQAEADGAEVSGG